MAGKRKGGLKLNAICAKLSRQVVYDGSSQHAEGDHSVAENSERGSSHYDDSGERFETNFPEGLSLGQSLEEDQKRRKAIEKWVNGEYGDEPPPSVLDCGEEQQQQQGLKPNNGEDGPPEGVYMVQPKGCSDEEDNALDEPEPMFDSRDGSYHDDKDSEDGPQKDVYMPLISEPPSRQTSFSSPGTRLSFFSRCSVLFSSLLSMNSVLALTALQTFHSFH